jgi:hypothetical protein
MPRRSLVSFALSARLAAVRLMPPDDAGPAPRAERDLARAPVPVPAFAAPPRPRHHMGGPSTPLPATMMSMPSKIRAAFSALSSAWASSASERLWGGKGDQKNQYIYIEKIVR